ncbi:hypothetical protein MXB_4276 [Myxobolus squamalis]|nr:hypothetical protein MXB_4276 [Myxobolus squamalis]
MKMSKKNSGKKKRLGRPEISAPTEFKHITHVGYVPDLGFDLENCDPAWKKLFSVMNVPENMLTDAKTSTFIYDFVAEKGGIDNFVGEIDRLQNEKKPIPTVDKPLIREQSAGSAPPLPRRSRIKENLASMSEDPISKSDSIPPPPPPPRLSEKNEIKLSSKEEDKSSSHQDEKDDMINMLARRLASMRADLEEDQDTSNDESADEWD